MFEENSFFSEANHASPTSVPSHLIGTREALFHILATRAAKEMPARDAMAMHSIQACQKFGESRLDWQSMLVEDDFRFRTG